MGRHIETKLSVKDETKFRVFEVGACLIREHALSVLEKILNEIAREAYELGVKDAHQPE